MEFNELINGLEPSRSMTFMAKAKQMQAKDSSVISLAGGEPDFDTPKAICEEMFKWVNKGYTHYTVGPGLPELRQRIARKLKEENGCDYDPDGIVVTPGGKFAIYLAVRAVVNPGDEVMFLEPGWVSYPSIIEASGAKSVPVRLKASEDFRLDRKLLEEHVTDKTKMLIINYPNNPTGRILSKEEALELREFMLAHPQVLLMADEIYERIVFDGVESVSMASFADLRDRVITINGFSKSVAMTGWRIGYLATTPAIKNVMYKLFQHTISCVSGFIQKAAVTALECSEEIEQMRVRYEQRRELFVGGLNKIPGVSCQVPQGAFYAWVSFDIPGMNDEQVCEYLLEKARVVGVPGSAYGTDGCFMRFSFAASEEDLTTAVNRIAEALAAL